MKNNWLAAIVVGASLLATAQPQSAREQTEFSAEDEAVKKPVPLPADVLDLLTKDNFVKDELQNGKFPTDPPPGSWFSASSIHLGPRADDLIVESNGALRGANVNTFWIFLTNPHTHRLVLMAPAHDLRVESHRTNGYRDITLISATADQVPTTHLRFNGHQYVLYRQKSEPIR